MKSPQSNFRANLRTLPRKLGWVLSLLALAGFITPTYAAREPKTDHPLISAYSGSSIYSKDVKEYDEYRVFLGWEKEKKEYLSKSLEGKVTKILYKNPKERSLLEIFRNYEAALKKEQAEILFQCNQADMECVDGYVGANLRREFGIHGIGNKAGRYVFAKIDQEDQTAYLVLSVGDQNTDIHVIEMKKMDEDQVSLNPTVIAEGLDGTGYFVLEAVYFDIDKTALKPESLPALEQAAALLKQRPELHLYVIGHTDMQGSLAHNMQLSTGRAKAVVTALSQEFGIAADRLEGHGVGPLVPVASNDTEGGRAQNRRVVLVKR